MTDETEFLLRRSVQMMEDDPKVAKEAFRAVAQKAQTPICLSCGKRIVHRAGLEWCEDHEMSEKTLQSRVMGRIKSRKITVMHIGKAIPAFDAQGEPVWITSALPGWPDLFILNDRPNAKGPRAYWMELKREDGEVSEEQVKMHALLRACGIPGVVIRPSNLRLGHVNAILEGR